MTKQFVTKPTFYGVLDSYWSERKGEEIQVYGNVWGVWDKEAEAFVGTNGVIDEDPSRAVMVDFARYLNENGYYDDYEPIRN